MLPSETKPQYREVSAEGQTHPHGRVSALVTHQKHQHQQHHAGRSARRMAVSQTASHSHVHAFATTQHLNTTPTSCTNSDLCAENECCTIDTNVCSSTEAKDPLSSEGMCQAATTETDSSTAAVTTTTTESTTAAANPLVPYKDKCQAELDADEDAKRLNRRCCDSRSLRAALGACGVTREDLESISSNTGGERNGTPLDGAADDTARSAMSDQLLWSKVYEGATKSELDGLIRQMDGNHVCMGICQFAAQKCWQLGYVRKSAPNACEGMKHWILTSSTTALLTGAAAPRASATWAFSALAGVLSTAFAVML